MVMGVCAQEADHVKSALLVTVADAVVLGGLSAMNLAYRVCLSAWASGVIITIRGRVTRFGVGRGSVR